MDSIRKLIVSGLGTGYMRPAPGTWGSAATCGVFALLLWILKPGLPLTICTGIIAALSIAGCVWLGDFMEKTYGRKDPSHCTLDEWAGQAVALLSLPLGNNWKEHLITIGIAFIAFRVFDITKPPPARQAERLSKGIGVVADDIIAGVYANIASLMILKLWIFA